MFFRRYKLFKFLFVSFRDSILIKNRFQPNFAALFSQLSNANTLICKKHCRFALKRSVTSSVFVQKGRNERYVALCVCDANEASTNRRGIRWKRASAGFSRQPRFLAARNGSGALFPHQSPWLAGPFILSRPRF